MLSLQGKMVPRDPRPHVCTCLEVEWGQGRVGVDQDMLGSSPVTGKKAG